MESRFDGFQAAPSLMVHRVFLFLQDYLFIKFQAVTIRNMKKKCCKNEGASPFEMISTHYSQSDHNTIYKAMIRSGQVPGGDWKYYFFKLRNKLFLFTISLHCLYFCFDTFT